MAGSSVKRQRWPWRRHLDHRCAAAAAPGRSDFIVVDQDLFTVAPAVIGKTQVLQMWVVGKRVFDRK